MGKQSHGRSHLSPSRRDRDESASRSQRYSRGRGRTSRGPSLATVGRMRATCRSCSSSSTSVSTYSLISLGGRSCRWQESLRRHGPDPTGPDAATDTLVAEVIPQLIDAGFGDRILLSHDVCFKTFLTAYGGTGYGYLLGKFMPYLQTQGVTEEQVNTIVVESPKRVLTLVEAR